MRHDIRILYLLKTPLCPCSVSVRLPTGSCKRGCFFCCKNSWLGGARYSLSHELSNKDFLRLWDQIIIKGDYRFMWPQKKILKALKRKRMLRFVREDLFEPSLSMITKEVLRGCFRSNFGLLVKTSSENVVNYITEIKRLKHCIVFSVTDLLKDYKEKIKAINLLVSSGVKTTLSLKPIYEYNSKTEYILTRVNEKILGVEVGWLYGNPSHIPPHYLTRSGFKVVRCEKQYKISHLQKQVALIRKILVRRGIPLRFYFSSQFYKSGSCCFVDKC